MAYKQGREYSLKDQGTYNADTIKVSLTSEREPDRSHDLVLNHDEARSLIAMLERGLAYKPKIYGRGQR